MTIHRLVYAAALAAGLSGATSAEVRHPKSLLAMSPERFRAATTLLDDPLEFHATFSTQKAHREGFGLFKGNGHDNHLRAIVDKATGQTRYEVRTQVRYYGAQRAYRAAHFATAAGLQRAPLTLEHDSLEPCGTNDNNANLNCALTKTIAFELDEAAVRWIAAHDQRGWSFKLKDDAGEDIRTAIVPAEAAGLLKAVDEYRARLRPTQLSSGSGPRIG